MKKIVILLFILSNINAFAFDDQLKIENPPNIGDKLVINQPSQQSYNYIEFPRLNFIAKRNGIANYKSVFGARVIIKNVTTKNDGSIMVEIELENEKKFFGYLKNVKANYNKAIESGEMSVL